MLLCWLLRFRNNKSIFLENVNFFGSYHSSKICQELETFSNDDSQFKLLSMALSLL